MMRASGLQSAAHLNRDAGVQPPAGSLPPPPPHALQQAYEQAFALAKRAYELENEKNFPTQRRVDCGGIGGYYTEGVGHVQVENAFAEACRGFMAVLSMESSAAKVAVIEQQMSELILKGGYARTLEQAKVLAAQAASQSPIRPEPEPQAPQVNAMCKGPGPGPAQPGPPPCHSAQPGHPVMADPMLPALEKDITRVRVLSYEKLPSLDTCPSPHQLSPQPSAPPMDPLAPQSASNGQPGYPPCCDPWMAPPPAYSEAIAQPDEASTYEKSLQTVNEENRKVEEQQLQPQPRLSLGARLGEGARRSAAYLAAMARELDPTTRTVAEEKARQEGLQQGSLPKFVQ